MTARRIGPWLLCIIVAGLVAGACGGGDEETVPATIPDVPTTSPSDAAADQGDVDEADGDEAGADDTPLEVLDAGAEPREAFRMTVTEGTTTRSALTTTMHQVITVDGQTLSDPGELTMRLTMLTTVDAVRDDGAARVRSTIEDAAVEGDTPPEVLDAAQASLDKIVGLTSTSTITPTGQVEGDAEVEIPEGIDPTVSQIFEQFNAQSANLTVGLPAEPVGVGARWRDLQHLDLGGIDLDVTYTYELRDVEDGILVLAVEQVMSAAPQPASFPNLPAGSTVDLQAYDVTSSGEVRLDRGQPMPVRSFLEGGGTARFGITIGNDSGTMVQDMDLRVAVEHLA